MDHNGTDAIKPGDFVLVEYKGKKGSKFYSVEVLEEFDHGYFVNFLKRQLPSWNFVFPKEMRPLWMLERSNCVF